MRGLVKDQRINGQLDLYLFRSAVASEFHHQYNPLGDTCSGRYLHDSIYKDSILQQIKGIDKANDKTKGAGSNPNPQSARCVENQVTIGDMEIES